MVGLGADGLSSACYGPEEAFLALGPHTPLSLYLAAMTAVTVFVIAVAYNQVIELCPNGGGGYKVASSLLGSHAGLVSGSALIVDYILTVSISVSSGVDALFSLFPVAFSSAKLGIEVLLTPLLLYLNLRGMKESIRFLLPIFIGFVLTHTVLIVYGVFTHGDRLPGMVADTVSQTRQMGGDLGWVAVAALLIYKWEFDVDGRRVEYEVSGGLTISDTLYAVEDCGGSRRALNRKATRNGRNAHDAHEAWNDRASRYAAVLSGTERRKRRASAHRSQNSTYQTRPLSANETSWLPAMTKWSSVRMSTSVSACFSDWSIARPPGLALQCRKGGVGEDHRGGVMRERRRHHLAGIDAARLDGSRPTQPGCPGSTSGIDQTAGRLVKRFTLPPTLPDKRPLTGRVVNARSLLHLQRSFRRNGV